jgi:hypothetical protein
MGVQALDQNISPEVLGKTKVFYCIAHIEPLQNQKETLSNVTLLLKWCHEIYDVTRWKSHNRTRSYRYTRNVAVKEFKSF